MKGSQDKKLPDQKASQRSQVLLCPLVLQDKVWVHDPEGVAWEIYTVLADSAVRDLKPAEMAIPENPFRLVQLISRLRSA